MCCEKILMWPYLIVLSLFNIYSLLELFLMLNNCASMQFITAVW